MVILLRCTNARAFKEFTIYTKHTFTQCNYVMKSAVMFKSREVYLNTVRTSWLLSAVYGARYQFLMKAVKHVVESLLNALRLSILPILSLLVFSDAFAML